MSPRVRTARGVDQLLEWSVIGSFSRLGYFARSRLESWNPPSPAPDRVILVTGATSGLGLTTALELARLGARVHLVGRNTERLDAARAAVQRLTAHEVHAYLCDLSSLRDTAHLADQLIASAIPLDVVIHNAGALLHNFQLSREGVETTLATHLLSPYLLSSTLLRFGHLNPGSRIITMTSGGMYGERFDLAQLEMTRENYRGATAYARAKRAQCVLTSYMHETYSPRGVDSYLVHPGWTKTPGLASLPTFEKIAAPLLRDVVQGADTCVWLATSARGEPEANRLWFDRHPRSLYRLPRTRMSRDEERRAGTELAAWCDARIARALTA